MGDELPVQAGPLVARFRRVGDRWRHELCRRQSPGGELHALAASLEGQSDEAWPPSPPLTQLDSIVLPDGSRGLLALGQAGRSHWSASIAAAGAEAIAFDVACRLSQPAERLGSSYRLLVPQGSLVFESLPVAGEPAGRLLANAGAWRIDVPPPIASSSLTVRWRYVVRLA